MGEMADELIDRMIDDGYWPGTFGCRSSRYVPKKPKVKTYPESAFKMGKFPVGAKHRRVEPEKPKEPDIWDTSGDAPF